MNPFVDPGYPAPTGDFTPRDASAITDFIVHHSDGPQSQTPLEIDAFERNGGDIYMPYTWLIGPDGTIYNGRPALVESAASFGRNEQSVAVCIIGAFQLDTPEYNGPPTPAALDQLLELCVYAHRTYPSIERTIAHRDIAPLFYPQDQGAYATACCGSVLYGMLPDIKAKVFAELHPV